MTNKRAAALVLCASLALLPAAIPSLAQEQSAPDPTEQPSTAERAWESLREAGSLASEAVREEAQRLRGQAEEALEDAGPAIDSAGSWVRQLQGRLEVFTKDAVADLTAAAQDLEKRIREATGQPVDMPGDPAAVLPPVDQLNADTRAAATPRPTGVVPDYVGVWADTAASCARIDSDAPPQSFAVVTPTTIRQAGSVCNMTGPALQDGRALIAAACFADGEEEAAQLELELLRPDLLRITTGEAGAEAAELTRCHLPR